MDNKKLSEKKQELMKPDWTENLHHELQELPLYSFLTPLFLKY